VRDVTPEATRKVLDRELPGLAEAMRSASAAKTPNAWLSRAVAGIRGETLIVNLPGSKRAAVENLEAILPVIPHAVNILREENVHPESDAGRMLMILK
jgi:molybdopterin biosynthesis enzyme MoaB